MSDKSKTNPGIAIDPVCGMEVNITQDAEKKEYNDKNIISVLPFVKYNLNKSLKNILRTMRNLVIDIIINDLRLIPGTWYHFIQ